MPRKQIPVKRPGEKGAEKPSDERSVSAFYNQQPPQEGNLPLRLLTDFSIFTRDEDGIEEPARLEELQHGKVAGHVVRARGQLLDPKMTAHPRTGGRPTSSAGKGRLDIAAVRDWVIDHAEPAAIWLISGAAWYRLIAPCEEYLPHFQPLLLQLRLAVAGAAVMSGDARAPAAQLTQQLLDRANGVEPAKVTGHLTGNLTGHPRASPARGGASAHDGAPSYKLPDERAVHGGGAVMQGLDNFWACSASSSGVHGTAAQMTHDGLLDGKVDRKAFDGTAMVESRQLAANINSSGDETRGGGGDCDDHVADGEDPYEAVPVGAIAKRDLHRHAEWLLHHLAPFAGRHILMSQLTQQLAATAGKDVLAAMTSARKLRPAATGAPAADSSRRPQPHYDFNAPPELRPTLCMIWDFCHRYRQLLRLAPFPLARLELAFLDSPTGLLPDAEFICRESTDSGISPVGRWGPVGQAMLLRDVHAALLRVLETVEDVLLPPPDEAGELAPPELGPHNAFRPLMGVTWPEMVRTVLAGHSLTIGKAAAAPAFRALKENSYELLEAKERVAILDALLHVAADSETLRSHIQKANPESREQEPGLLGSDGGGCRYFQMAADHHGGRLLVEQPQGGPLGWYNMEDLPTLLEWLEGGSDAEQALADVVFEAFHPFLPPQLASGPGGIPPPGWRGPSEAAPADGFRGLPTPPAPNQQLAEVMISLIKAAPFWDRGEDWLACRASVMAAITTAKTGPAMARLLWMVEDLTYEEALRGTGWGRRRGWFRDALHKSTTLAQTAMVAAALASHCRRAPDMGILDAPAFAEVVAQRGALLPKGVPEVGATVVVARAACEAARRALQPGAPPLEWPANWQPLETCQVLEVAYTRGQAPITRSAAEDTSRAAAWVLVAPLGEDATAAAAAAAASGAPDRWEQLLPAACDGEIDWTLFSFGHGFRHPRLPSGASAGPRLVAARLKVLADGEYVTLTLQPLVQSETTKPPLKADPTSALAAPTSGPAAALGPAVTSGPSIPAGTTAANSLSGSGPTPPGPLPGQPQQQLLWGTPAPFVNHPSGPFASHTTGSNGPGSQAPNAIQFDRVYSNSMPNPSPLQYQHPSQHPAATFSPHHPTPCPGPQPGGQRPGGGSSGGALNPALNPGFNPGPAPGGSYEHDSPALPQWRQQPRQPPSQPQRRRPHAQGLEQGQGQPPLPAPLSGRRYRTPAREAAEAFAAQAGDAVQDEEVGIGRGKRKRQTRNSLLRGDDPYQAASAPTAPATEFYELDRDNLARIKAEPVGPRGAGGLLPLDYEEPIQFWVKQRRLVAVELRPVPPGVHVPPMLLPPAAVHEAAARVWPAGTGVRMPARVEQPVNPAAPKQGTDQQVYVPRTFDDDTPHWHRGVLVRTFDPTHTGGAGLVGALTVQWDERLMPPLPVHVSPWEVEEDPGRSRKGRAPKVISPLERPVNGMTPNLVHH